jgi:hypothetical protein
MSSLARSPLATLARKAALLCAIASGFASPAHAVTYTEVGDAGQTQATAQVAGGVGVLTDIFGLLRSPLDADLYLIKITDPATFSASTVNATTGFLDTQLFLLTLAGAPLLLNDDEGSGLSVSSRLPSGSAASLAAGLYLLGISQSGYDPANSVNQLLFASGLSTAVRGPASGLQPAVLGQFADNTFFADSGQYDIQLTGVAAVPEPEISVMLLLGGAFCAYAGSRRRRKASPAAIAA